MASVTINGELYHYGVKGMKWGVRKAISAYGKYNTIRKKQYESAAAKSRTRFGRMNNIAAAGRYEELSNRANNVNKAKGLYRKIDAAVGYGAAANKSAANAKTASKLEAESKSKLAKAIYKQSAANNKELNNYYKKAAKDDIVERYVRTRIYDSEFMSMPYHRLSGRTTTRGKDIVENMLTLGMAGAVKDLKYINAQKKEKEDKK